MRTVIIRQEKPGDYRIIDKQSGVDISKLLGKVEIEIVAGGLATARLGFVWVEPDFEAEALFDDPDVVEFSFEVDNWGNKLMTIRRIVERAKRP